MKARREFREALAGRHAAFRSKHVEHEIGRLADAVDRHCGADVRCRAFIVRQVTVGTLIDCLWRVSGKGWLVEDRQDKTRQTDGSRLKLNGIWNGQTCRENLLLRSLFACGAGDHATQQVNLDPSGEVPDVLSRGSDGGVA
jgi:hypothetical protein